MPRGRKGPPESPLRLAIYSWMLAKDAVQAETDNFRKRLEGSTKPVATNEEMKDQLRGELKRGFPELSGPDSSKARQAHGRGPSQGMSPLKVPLAWTSY